MLRETILKCGKRLHMNRACIVWTIRTGVAKRQLAWAKEEEDISFRLGLVTDITCTSIISWMNHTFIACMKILKKFDETYGWWAVLEWIARNGAEEFLAFVQVFMNNTTTILKRCVVLGHTAHIVLLNSSYETRRWWTGNRQTGFRLLLVSRCEKARDEI